MKTAFFVVIFFVLSLVQILNAFDQNTELRSDEVPTIKYLNSLPKTQTVNSFQITNFNSSSQKSIIMVANQTKCPEKCNCLNGIVYCTNAGKIEIPSINELPSDTEVIDLSFNQIKHLSKIDNLSKLKRIILRNNWIESVNPEIFENSTNIEELDLSFNEKIDLPINLIKPLHNLKILKLKNCNISKLDVDFFEKNEHLTHLYLNSNPLGKLTKNFFQHLKNLKFLDLTNTKLEILDIGSEYPLSNLKEINLSENLLEYVPLFKYSSNIETLILDYNRIGVLNKDSFIDLKNLRNLFLSHNDDLLDVEELTFSRQINLQKLVLSNNNHLFLISNHAFYGMYNSTHFPLKELNLQKNSLHFISEDLLADHWGELDSLDIRINPFNCNCHLKWLHKYESNKNVSQLRCALPEKLRNKRFFQIEPDEMICVKLIDSLLYNKIKLAIQGFVIMIIFLVFALSFLLLYIVQDRKHGWMRLFSSPSSSTIYYQKANTKEQSILM